MSSAFNASALEGPARRELRQAIDALELRAVHVSERDAVEAPAKRIRKLCGGAHAHVGGRDQRVRAGTVPRHAPTAQHRLCGLQQ